MMLGRLMRFSSSNIFTNLAAEERIFQTTKGSSLLFYVNSDSVVLGRTQNPFNEADVSFAAAHSIPIARRRSGGGTVVHDEGNLNFSFMRPRAEHEPLSNAKLVAEVLCEDFGIPAVVNNRADILVEGKKISGAAYRISKDRAYHHGTLLVNSNLDRLRRLLRSPLRAGIQTMGAKSVPSPVTRLADHHPGELKIDEIIAAIAERFSRSNSPVQLVTPEQVDHECGEMQAAREELSSHKWVYGQAPKFSSVHTLGNLSLRFEMIKGAVVRELTYSQDRGVAVISENDMARLKACLEGLQFDGSVISQAMSTLFADDESQVFKKLCDTLRTEIPSQFWDDELDDAEQVSLKDP